MQRSAEENPDHVGLGKRDIVPSPSDLGFLRGSVRVPFGVGGVSLEFAWTFWRITFLVSRCSEGYAPRSTHQLQALLAGKQRGGLGYTEMPARGCRQDKSTGGGVVGCLIDEQSVILAEAQIPGMKPATSTLQEFAHGHTPILRIVGEGRPGLLGVGELRHVEWHIDLLLPPAFL